MTQNYILRLSCPDRFGIVAAVATTLSAHNCNIEESSQFHDKLSERFFMRVVFSTENETRLNNFKTAFQNIADEYHMDWSATPKNKPVKTLIMVSKADHCLNDILYRWRTKQLNIDITAIGSNHDSAQELVEQRGLNFHHLPMEDKNKQETQLSNLIDETGTELIILARYMQILTNDICERYAGRIINIHHSFLPSFKGAKPYHQAHERGVKIIGATAHFATADLDEGPIIEQDTVRITHADNPRRLQILGRDTESKVLARAIELYSERRVFMHGKRTVIL